MPENEFDKQVKSMMDDLKLRPSESVWPDVEKRIRENRRRRRAFIIFPLLAGIILLGYAGTQYFLSKSENPRPGVNSTNETSTTENTKQPGNKISSPLLPSDADKTKEIGIKNLASEKISIKKETPPKVQSNRTSSLQKTPNDNASNAIAGKKTLKFPPAELKNESTNPEVANKEDKKLIIDTPSADYSIPEKDNNVLASLDTITKVSRVDSNKNLNTNDSNQLKEVIRVKTSLDSVASIKKQHVKNLTWGFHLSTGVSGTRNKLFQLKQNSSLESRSSQNSGAGGPLFSAVPNRSNAGFAFQAGVLVEKNLTKRNSMDVGIQYSYYSDHIRVGGRTDSSIRIVSSYSADLLVSGFYMPSPANNYTNHYHFIEIPVNHHLQLLNSKQRSLSWDIGVTFGQLLSTNTLVFDTTNRGVYFTDEKLFRKTHFSLSTGFSLTVNRNKSMQWIIGPKLQLGLSNLYNNYTDKKSYLNYAGVDLRLMLPKK